VPLYQSVCQQQRRVQQQQRQQIQRQDLFPLVFQWMIWRPELSGWLSEGWGQSEEVVVEQQPVRQRDEEEVLIQILEGERVEVPAVDSYQLATDNALDAAKLVILLKIALKKSSSPVRSRADFDGLQKISLQCSPPHHHGKH
jgi:hypothetical protein